MSSHSPEAIKKQIQIYLRVFAALAGLTVVTVAISYVHLPILYAVAAGLFVAAVKGSLVAAFFMHLTTEKKIIWMILFLTLIFLTVLLSIPFWQHA